MSRPLQLEFVTSADTYTKLPPSGAEVAVVGRSNVGKSSLLNALANRNQLAKVSKTPGRTQLLNCFRLDEQGFDATLVDCPGYGYAKVPKHVSDRWGPMIEDFLIEREPLTMVMALVDGAVGPTDSDLQLLDWMRATEIPFTVVATKHDKVKPSKRERRKDDLAGACGLERKEVVWVSAEKKVNVDRLRELVRGWLR